jgi:GT2 family glycosyltransferase
MTETWAVVPSNGRSFLRECLDALLPQVEGIIVVSNGESDFPSEPRVEIMTDERPDVNISRWWNMGIDAVAAKGLGEWNVLVVNDDVIVPSNFVQILSDNMRSCSAAISFPNQHDNHRMLWRDPEPVNLFWRLTGYCFMMRGEIGLRLDESLVWWYGDDDLDWRARANGGSYLVPGCSVEHRAPNGSMLGRPDLHVQAGKDRETFIRKWGQAPW